MSANLSLPAPTTFNGVTYRTIYTIKESQSLYDDLVLEPATLPVLQSWDNESSGIDHSQTSTNRPFQYAEVSTIDVLIDPLKWKASRFSDGTFGVWYGSLDEETAIKESLYQSYIFAKEELEEGNFPVPVERKMFSADIQTDASVDLSKIQQSDKLVSEDYSFCQELGRHALKEAIGMYMTPSARKPNGTCTPVFKAECVKRDRTLYFLKFTFLSKDKVRITKDEDTLAQIPDNWK